MIRAKKMALTKLLMYALSVVVSNRLRRIGTLIRKMKSLIILRILMFAGPIVVRTEEVLIVVFVLILWACAIALFFNRWGKIRMLEPYQPKFHEEEHRPSCPLVELTNPVVGQVCK